MSLQWIHETPAKWDADKQRMIGDAPRGVFDRRFAECKVGELLPGEWWRVERDGKTVGYGWLDIVWGDAEVTLVSDPKARGSGVGSFILERLEQEAKRSGVNYVYNTVRASHPEKEDVTDWLRKRGFEASEDGSLLHALIPAKASA